MYPYPPFKQQVQTVLIEKVLAIFHKCPFFVISLKELLIATIADTGAAGRAELILTLCWIVGEYTNLSVNATCTSQVIHDYHEALELFNDERISVVRLGIKNIASLSAQPGQSFAPHDPLANHAGASSSVDDAAEHLSAVNTARLMLVVINSLSKLASRCQDLAPRVVLSLTKLVQHQQYFLPIVAQRAEECRRILKFPSVASAILDAPQHANNSTDASSGRTSHIDENSALHFVLQPAATQLIADEAIPLHQFELQ